MGDQERLPSGFLKDIANLQLPPQAAFAGHVRLVQGVVLPIYVGCHAVVMLNDPAWEGDQCRNIRAEVAKSA